MTKSIAAAVSASCAFQSQLPATRYRIIRPYPPGRLGVLPSKDMSCDVTAWCRCRAITPRPPWNRHPQPVTNRKLTLAATRLYHTGIYMQTQTTSNRMAIGTSTSPNHFQAASVRQSPRYHRCHGVCGVAIIRRF
jgi:hypothetical protein